MTTPLILSSLFLLFLTVGYLMQRKRKAKPLKQKIRYQLIDE